MRQQHVASVSLAGVMLATPAHASSGSASTYLAYIEWSLSVLLDALAAGYRAAPALMLGLIALVAVPVTAFAARIAAWRRERSLPPPHQPEQPSSDGPAPSVHAFVEVVGREGARIAILHDMLRIGRESDNDIRIRSQRVHRYHAAIYREEFGHYRIADLSGEEGNGVCVNGERCDETELKDGDVIELGRRRLRFHAGLV